MFFAFWHFTFHNVSIKTDANTIMTMVQTFFTFHNVSIKTGAKTGWRRYEKSLHSTMFLLKLLHVLNNDLPEGTLHSTMFLLKLLTKIRFTLVIQTLHSTMFLLKPGTDPGL